MVGNWGGFGQVGAFRSYGRNTQYKEIHTPWQADWYETGWALAFALLAFAFLLILPSFRFNKSTFFRYTVLFWCLLNGALIMVANYSYEWRSGSLSTRTQYKAFQPYEIHAKVGLHVGLRGINITLEGEPRHQLGEEIFYNEHYNWEWQQGRIGFGPYAAHINRDFRASQFRGVPYPIQWIAEYFTLDGEQIRWGRYYRYAGYYCHIMMWTCFPIWVLMCGVFAFGSLKQALQLMGFLGFFMILAPLVYGSLIKADPTVPLQFPFPSGVLTISYGWAFYTILAFGLFNFFVGFGAAFLGKALIRKLKFYPMEDLLVLESKSYKTSKMERDSQLVEMEEPPTQVEMEKVDTDSISAYTFSEPVANDNSSSSENSMEPKDKEPAKEPAKEPEEVKKKHVVRLQTGLPGRG
jgi:hypothetical protein